MSSDVVLHFSGIFSYMGVLEYMVNILASPLVNPLEEFKHGTGKEFKQKPTKNMWIYIYI